MAKKETPVDEVSKLYQMGMDDSAVIRRLSEEGYTPVQISDALNQAKIKQQIAGSQAPGSLSPLPPLLPPSKAPPLKALPAMPALPQAPQMQQMPALPPPAPKPEIPIPKPSAVPPSPMPPAAAKPAPAEEMAYPYAYPTYEEQAAPQPQIETEAIEEIAEEIVNEKWREIKSKISDVVEWKAYAEKRLDSVDERIKRLESSIDRLQAALLTKVNEYGRSIKDLGAEMNSLEGALGKILSPLVENVKELGKITEEIKAEKRQSIQRKRKL